MPYIEEEDRKRLDPAVTAAVEAFLDLPMEESLGDLNYLISRIVAGVVGKPSYRKIAMATGVLENVKQELYRRMAAPYEDRKIAENGDVPEYGGQDG
jgi:hypothetical protein